MKIVGAILFGSISTGVAIGNMAQIQFDEIFGEIHVFAQYETGPEIIGFGEVAIKEVLARLREGHHFEIRSIYDNIRSSGLGKHKITLDMDEGSPHVRNLKVIVGSQEIYLGSYFAFAEVGGAYRLTQWLDDPVRSTREITFQNMALWPMGTQMKIYFDSTKVVRHLGRQLTKAVRSWGDEIYLMEAHTIIARTFGYEDYSDLLKFVGLGVLSQPDRSVPSEEQEKRLKQYIDILSENDFSRDEAVSLVKDLRAGGWWGFGGETVEAILQPEIEASPNKMQFRDEATIGRFYRTFKKSLKNTDVSLTIGPRKLMAKLFGYETYSEFQTCAGHGVPTPSDAYISPEELDERVMAYLRVLKSAGLSDDQARDVLHDAGAEGWWQLKRIQPTLDARQVYFANRIEGSGKPTWLPNGGMNSQLHRRERPAKTEAYVLLENNDPFDEVYIHAMLRYGEVISGYCDFELGPFIDRMDFNLRTEIASLYREVLAMPDTGADFLIVRQSGVQRVTDLKIVHNHQTQAFSNYDDFVRQGGRRLFEAKERPTPVLVKSQRAEIHS
jgi:hypothetical protein